MASKEELFEKLKNGVIEYQEDEVGEAAQAVLDEGYVPLEAIMDGLAAGMEVVGDLYEKQEYFVPEVLMCADALYAGLEILRPHVPEQEGGLNAQVVIGSIQGDVHDIGKNLVRMMFEAAGWNVYDLGKDVPLDKFVDELVKTKSAIVGISAMMTTSMLAMPVVIKKLRDANPDVRILIGGAPISADVVEKYGADSYAKSAGTAVDEAIRLIDMLRKEGLGE